MHGQGFGWWNDRHDWDGVSPWQNYLILSPAFMGPNALPVPHLRNGSIRQRPEFSLAAEGHFSRGDDTQNIYAELFLPLFSDRVGLRVSSVPLEHYRMTPETRDLRRARDYDARGTAYGDIYLGTHIQLLRDRAGLPDLLLTVNVRTASGTRLSAARFTDTPGYFFDLSVGKSFALAEEKLSVRPFALVGFYVWQTYHRNNPQNDAFLYGLGAEVAYGKFELRTGMGGYSGYRGDGDHPLVYRIQLATRRNMPLDYVLRFQQGLHDFPFSSLRIGIVWRPERKKGPAKTISH
ncbi:hypothetical protein GGR28_003538 [Lewinella aquimaris]|uniref:Uncharacterized protein n=1 Tax=Neolewinella aquimaris TaxID=1835722 RepID=A0A840EGG1_9BACT|nr:hypothetical protein [Neolewinella aquimaris]MBB4080899.1 hypothetical protein [Neolewinella aquimaris]